MSESSFRTILDENYHDGVTRGNPNYPHVWPNETAITTMGVRHYDPERAACDVANSFKGQWSNGMIPHQTYDPTVPFVQSPDKRFWRHYRMSKPEQMPKGLDTSGVATVPIVAQGVWAAAEKLDASQRKEFLKETVPKVVAFHEWFYRERSFGQTGMVASIHPYETGMNGLPHWGEVMAADPASRIAKIAKALPFDLLVKTARKDKVSESGDVSLSINAGVLAVTSIFALSGTNYDTRRIQEEWPYQIEDILVNSALIANNHVLLEAADEAGIDLPDELLDHMKKHPHSLKAMQNNDGNYYSSTIDGKILTTPDISNLAPVMTGDIPQESILKIANSIRSSQGYGTPYPLPTTPSNSPFFNSEQEDVGAIKPAMNLLIAKGLLATDQKELGRTILQETVAMISGNGDSFGKVYSSKTGKPLDRNRDSTTAAVAVESLHLLKQA